MNCGFSKFASCCLACASAPQKLNHDVRRIREVLRHQSTQFSLLEAMVQVSACAAFSESVLKY